MTFKMPEADAYLVYDKAASSQYVCFDDELGDPDGLDIRPLYTADALRDVLEAAALVCMNMNRGWCSDARHTRRSDNGKDAAIY